MSINANLKVLAKNLSRSCNLVRHNLPDTGINEICIDILSILLQEDMQDRKLKAILELKGHNGGTVTNVLNYLKNRKAIILWKESYIYALGTAIREFIVGKDMFIVLP